MKKENTPVLETERLILRKFTDDDVADMLPLYGDDEVNTFLPWFPMKTLAQAERYLHETILACYRQEVAYTYAVALQTSQRVIGYFHIHDIGGSNDMGYGLCKEFWHKGITTEAGTALVNHLRTVQFPFLTATHDRNNPNSGAVMKKLGMTYRYTYEEQWQPKNILVAFRMYQLNLHQHKECTYLEYWSSHKNHWLEAGV